ncbi:MAG TPA: metal-dependent hydrolase, partial [Anaerolineae bacterium]|nr:metal-dependent hydrolase [Anaerolineae bacterium]
MTSSDWPIEIIRSEKRRKTVSASVENGRLIIRAPARMSERELRPIVEKLRARLAKRANLTPQTNNELATRAQQLNRELFDGKLRWHSVRYVTNQNKRYGS